MAPLPHSDTALAPLPHSDTALALFPHSDTAPFLPHIHTTGLHLWFLPSTACSSTRTRPSTSPHPTDWLRLFSSQTFSRINIPKISSLLFFLLTPPMKMEDTECYETSAYKIQTSANRPKEEYNSSLLLKGVLCQWWLRMAIERPEYRSSVETEHLLKTA